MPRSADSLRTTSGSQHPALREHCAEFVEPTPRRPPTRSYWYGRAVLIVTRRATAC